MNWMLRAGNAAVAAPATRGIKRAGTAAADTKTSRRVGRSTLFTGRRDATFRMYPAGFGQALAGWSRTLASGIGATRWWVLLGVAAWVWSLAGGPFVGWLAYPLSAVQVLVLGGIAVLLAAINLAGGFLVTARMLRMFRK